MEQAGVRAAPLSRHHALYRPHHQYGSRRCCFRRCRDPVRASPPPLAIQTTQSQEDVLVGEISHLLQSSRLPVLAQPYPPFIQKAFEGVVALRSGQRAAYLDGRVFVDNIQDLCHNAHRLSFQLDDPSLVPDEMAHVRAEMTAAVGCMRLGFSAAFESSGMSAFTQANTALLQYEASAYASLPTQTICNAQKTHLDHMQLSLSQVAHFATVGIDLIATLRQLGASSNAEDDLQLAFPSFTGASDDARDAKLEAVSRITMQLCCAEWLADEQLIRMQSKHPREIIIPNVFPMLLVLARMRTRSRSRSPAAQWKNPCVPRASI
ncbi:hypothetical protein WJX73_009676 [Symbiochloris irregularis]|uniref:Uncharacterized protein n=1 Tax=Symbiochloris irregularis TaxID=706552 RepID=A0AAW1PWM2_9CHLO